MPLVIIAGEHTVVTGVHTVTNTTYFTGAVFRRGWCRSATIIASDRADVDVVT